MARLSILSPVQLSDFETPPELSIKEKEVFFNLDEWVSDLIKDLRSPASKIGFVLTLGYF